MTVQSTKLFGDIDWCVQLESNHVNLNDCEIPKATTIYYYHQVKIWDRSSWDKEDVWSEDDGWKGPQLLKMAGLFSRWTSSEVRV